LIFQGHVLFTRLFLLEISAAYAIVTLFEWNCAIQTEFDLAHRTSDDVGAFFNAKNITAVWCGAVLRIISLALVDAKRFGVVQQLLLFGHHPIEIRARKGFFA
jgi:hypothetical protein